MSGDYTPVENFVSNNSPIYNVAEAVAGQTFIIGQPLTPEDQQAKVEKAKNMLAEGAVFGSVGSKGLFINAEKQGRHVLGNTNFQTGRSILTQDATTLLKDYAGTGQMISANKERVNFGKVIGKYYVDPVTGKSVDTSFGIIHYSNTGAHIVPAKPGK